jgi:hypothetical protein
MRRLRLQVMAMSVTVAVNMQTVAQMAAKPYELQRQEITAAK